VNAAIGDIRLAIDAATIRDRGKRQEEIMWTAVFSVVFALAVALSIAALVVQSDRIRYP
jgi:hypothetical protein